MQLTAPDYPAPAKLNLFLHVVGRRPDGYHLLQSVFTLIDLHDRVRLLPVAALEQRQSFEKLRI